MGPKRAQIWAEADFSREPPHSSALPPRGSTTAFHSPGGEALPPDTLLAKEHRCRPALPRADLHACGSNPYFPFQPVEVRVGEAKLPQPAILFQLAREGFFTGPTSRVRATARRSPPFRPPPASLDARRPPRAPPPADPRLPAARRPRFRAAPPPTRPLAHRPPARR
nr:formin-like protein 16 [Lolium perenne]